MAAVGLADLALLEGHSAAAAGGLENTIAADLRENNPDAAAAKLLLLAEAEVANRQPAAGLRSAERALALSR